MPLTRDVSMTMIPPDPPSRLSRVPEETKTIQEAPHSLPAREEQQAVVQRLVVSQQNGSGQQFRTTIIPPSAVKVVHPGETLFIAYGHGEHLEIAVIRSSDRRSFTTIVFILVLALIVFVWPQMNFEFWEDGLRAWSGRLGWQA